MKSLQHFIFFFILLIFISCENTPEVQSTEIIQLDFSKDLIPEGIAVDGKTKKIFFSSLPLDKIVQSDLSGQNTFDFINKKQYNYRCGLGMETYDGKLFAIGSYEMDVDEPNSILLVLNPANGELIHSYHWKDTTNHFFNDLAISSQGEIYLTNSHGNSIFKLNYPDGEIEKFMTSDEFVYGNGITISTNNKYLYAATSKNGVRIIDIENKKIVNPPSEISRGMDGLKFYKNHVLAMCNGYETRSKHQLVRLKLNEEGTAITGKEVIYAADENFDIPTTFDILDDVVYFISNSQLDHFRGSKLNRTEELQSYILIKHPLK